MNTDSDCAILLGQIFNDHVLPLLVNYSLGATCLIHRLIGLPQEGAFAVLQTRLRILQSTNFGLILHQLLEHLLLTSCIKESSRWNGWLVNEVQTRSFIKGLLHIRCYNIQDTVSLPSLLSLIIPSLSDGCVLWIVHMKLRSNVPWSLDGAWIRQLPVTLLDLNSLIIGLFPVCSQLMSCVELWLLQRVRMHRIG